MILIASKREGFRRAGIAHPSAATEHADNAFTPEQLEALLAEPMLVVTVLKGAKIATAKAVDFAGMTKAELVDYASEHFGIDLDPKTKHDDLVAEVKALATKG